MNAFFYIVCVHKLQAAASQIQAKMQKVFFDMSGFTKVMCLQTNNYIRYNFPCSFCKIFLYNPMTLLLFQNTTVECLIKFHPVTCLMASVEYMEMFLSVLLGLGSLSIIYALFSSVSQ